MTKMKHQGVSVARKAVTGVLATLIIFAALFSFGVGYLVFLNQTSIAAYQANGTRESGIQQSSQEKLYVSASVSNTLPSPITLTIANHGGVATTIIGTFVDNSAGDLQSTVGSMSVTLNVGASTTLSVPGYSYTATSGTVYVSVITSRGNTFTVQYPLPQLTSTTTVTSTTSTATTTTLPYTGIGSNALVLNLVASPPAAFGCSNGCVSVTATVYNYDTQTMNGVALDPNPLTVTICTGNTPGCTATVTACNLSGSTCTTTSPTCTGPFNSGGGSDAADTIPAYSGSGSAPYIYFVCYYNTYTGTSGGFATFTGQATGNLGPLTPVASSVTTSNAIRIGGSANVLNQGPFSADFFYFKYSACTGTSPCNPSPGFSGSPNTPTGTLLDGYLTSGNSYYVAYYLQITNNFNTSLPILQYTYFQTDATIGNDADFFIAGPASNSTFYSLPTSSYSPDYPYPPYSGQPVYYPNYVSSPPSLTAYTGSVFNCDTAQGGNPDNCIDVNPGKTVTLTFAACNLGSNSWEWYNQPNGANSGGGSISCTNNGATTNSPSYTVPEAAWFGIVIFFVYNGQVYAQQIPFTATLVCNTNC